MGCLCTLLSARGVLSMGAAPKLSDGLRSCSSRGRGLSVCFADSRSYLQCWPVLGWLQNAEDAWARQGGGPWALG